MERFSGEFRRRYESKEHLDGLEQAYDALVRMRRESIHFPTVIPELAESGRAPNNPIDVLVLMQTAIRRALELTDAMIRDANAFAYTPVWINSRSLFELGSLAFDTWDKVRDLLANWDLGRYREFDTHLAKIQLGFKSSEWHPGRERGEHLDLVPQNIITIMQRIDKRHIPGFFSLYELLSEVAHPNYLGMMGQYHTLQVEKSTAVFHDRPAERSIAAITVPLDNAHGALGMLVNAVESYEGRLTDYALLCAKNIPPDDPGPIV